MTTTYTITLDDSEVKAMEYEVYSIQDWAENALKNRARKAKDKIYNSEVVRMTDDPDITSIPADIDQVVLDADIKTAKEITDANSAKTPGVEKE